MSWAYFIEFQELRALFSSRNFLSHIRVYYTVLLENFHIHFMVFMLLKLQLTKENINKQNFIHILKSLLSNFIQSLHFSPTVRYKIS